MQRVDEEIPAENFYRATTARLHFNSIVKIWLAGLRSDQSWTSE